MVKIKRVGVLKMASFLGLYGVFIGIVFALVAAMVISFVSSLFSVASVDGVDSVSGVEKFGFNWINLLIFPIGFGVVNFIFGLIFTPVANLILKLIKGLDLDMESETLDDHRQYMPPQNYQVPKLPLNYTQT